MVKVSVPAFLKALEEHQLLDENQLAEIRQQPLASGDDLKALAKVMVDKKWLTIYQAQQVAQGNAQDLNLGPYLILELIGKGGMGEVFKAKQRTMGRLVALKVMTQERLAAPAAVKRFRREMKSLAQLVHPNVVIAYDAGQEGETHYFAMEYVEGTNLNKLVKQSGPLPVAQACAFIRQAALGLQAAHERGLIHRDLKPANLLITAISDGPSAIGQKSAIGDRPTADSRQPTAVVKIIDLGLALCKEHGSQQTVLTKLGTVLGTPEYLSPEQALNSSAVDARADLYSLGCTLFYALAGRPPFQSENVTDLLLQHTTEAPPPITRFRPEVPEDIQNLLARLLAKRPEDRFQTAAEVAEALTPFCAAEGDIPLTAPEKKSIPSAAEPDASEAESETTLSFADGAGWPGRLKNWQQSPFAVGILSFVAVLLLGGALLYWLAPEAPQASPLIAQLENQNQPGPQETPPAPKQPPAKPIRPVRPEPKPTGKSKPEPPPKFVPEPQPAAKSKPQLQPEFVPEPQPEKPKDQPQHKEEPKPEEVKLPLPSDDTVAKLAGVIRQEYKALYAGPARAEKKKLVDHLLGRAQESQKRPAWRYVLLQEAGDLAAQAGLIEEAWETLTQIDETFAIDDGLERKAKALAKAAPKAPPTPLAQKAQLLAEEQIEEDRFEAALKTLTLGEKAARLLPKNTEMVAEFQARIREVKELFQEVAEQEALKKAKTILQKDADNPEANTILGKYLCLRKGNWEDGLPLLAKGDDPKLQELAQKEQEPEKASAPALEKLADSWQALAKKEKDGPYRVPMLERARYWYAQALEQHADKDRLRLQGRLKVVDKLLSAEEGTARIKEGPVRPLDCEKAIKQAQNYFGQGRFGEAARALKAAAEATADETSKEKIQPFLLFADKMNVAQKASLKGKYGESVRLFDEAGEMAPDNTTRNFARYLFHLATAWRASQAGKRQEAQLAYDAAKKVLPSIQTRNALRCSCQ